MFSGGHQELNWFVKGTAVTIHFEFVIRYMVLTEISKTFCLFSKLTLLFLGIFSINILISKY